MKNTDTATKRVVRKVLEGAVTPLYDADIIAEYKEVLKRHIEQEPDSFLALFFFLTAPKLFFCKPAVLTESVTTMSYLGRDF